MRRFSERPTQLLRSRRQREKVFQRVPSSFSTSKKAAAWCRCKRPTFTRWVDAVNGSGFRAGVYCSGIPAREDKNTTIVTADDIRDNAQGRQIIYWVTNDVCPPSPGCAFPGQPPRPAESKIDFADIWQFVQSPRRPDFAAKCHNYNRDGNCYPPGINPSSHSVCGCERGKFG